MSCEQTARQKYEDFETCQNWNIWNINKSKLHAGGD